jgi:hypothetical protein
LPLISRNEIIVKYQITGGQINYAVTKKVFPKRACVKQHNEVFYDELEIKEYFKKNPVKPSKRSTPKRRDRSSIFLSDMPDTKQTIENKRMASFNRFAVMFNIQKRERETIKKPAGKSALVNKYKPIKREVIELHDVHEHMNLVNIDGFAQIHDENHRVVI